MFLHYTLRLLTVILLAFSLTACGGGGGGGGNGKPPSGDNPPGGGGDDGDDPPSKNQPPVASISAPESGLELAEIVLSAAGSKDPDDDELTFEWKQTAGSPAMMVSGSKSAELTITAPKVEVAEILEFEVTVSDGEESVTERHELEVTEGQGLLVLASMEERTVELFRIHDADDQPVRISEDLSPPSEDLEAGLTARITAFSTSPDRRHVAYLVDTEGDGTSRLKLGMIDGSDVRDISGVLVEGASIEQFEWSPSGEHIAFLANANNVEIPELFVVPANTPDGNDRIAVSGVLEAGLGVHDFAWSPNSSELAIYGNLDADRPGVDDLHVARKDGSIPPVAVSDNGTTTSIRQYAWSPNGARILFVSKFGDTVRLKLVNSNGTNLTTLVQQNAPQSVEIMQAAWSPTGSVIAIRGEITRDDRTDMYSLEVDANNGAGELQRLSSQTIPEQDVLAGFYWTHDGNQLIFRNARVQVVGDGRPNGLYRKSLTGAILRIDGDSAIPNEGLGVQDSSLSPDGAHVAFLTDGDTQNKLELYSVPVDTTDPSNDRRKLSPDMDSDPERSLLSLTWSPDGSSLAVTGNPLEADKIGLYTVPADGGVYTDVLGNTLFGMSDFKWFGPPPKK